MHSSLNAILDSDRNEVLLGDLGDNVERYRCFLFSHRGLQATLTRGYTEELTIPGRAVDSDASEDVIHMNWQLAQSCEHKVVACCVSEDSSQAETQCLISLVQEM